MDDNFWSANIDCLIIHKNYQNKGLATTLIQELLNDIRHIHYISVCPDSLIAKRLFIKQGFIEMQTGYLQKKLERRSALQNEE